MFINLEIEVKISSLITKNSKKLSCSNKVYLSFSKRKAIRRRMAIAYYVPPGIGNEDPAQQQQQQVQHDNPRIVDIHQEHFHQDANNNNVMRRNIPQQQQPQEARHNQLVSLFTNAVTEVLEFFGNRSAAVEERNRNVQRGGGGEQSFRMRRIAAQQLPNINIQQDQDNQAHQQPPSAAPDVIPTPFRALPDLISCHAGMSFRYNSHQINQQEDNITNNDDDEPNVLSSSRDRPPVVPLSPASSQHHLPTTMDFEVSLKLEMSVGQENESSASLQQEYEDQADLTVPASPEEVYRAAGARLRTIADNFERSRRTTHRPSTQSTFELKIVISVAVPTVALVGLGLAYFRR